MTDIETAPETGESRLPVHVGAPIAGLDQVYRLARNLAVASLMPRDLRGKPSDVLAILLYGQDLGLSPMQSVQGIYVVEGRPSLAAQTWIALARRAGHKVSVTDRVPDVSCTVEIVRGDTGESHTETSTIEHAVKAGRVVIKDGKPYARSREGKPLPWETYTDRLLLARAVSNCARFICPEIALGFYSEADADDLRDGLADNEVVPVVRVDTPAPAPAPSPEPEDAVIVDDAEVKDQLDQLADQFDFSHAGERDDDD